MIRFYDEWDLYPSAIPDLTTQNISFLRLAKVWADMGIKNNAFHLALYQPELQGVDPFDPNLSQEQMAMITQEAKHNPWYFLREVCRVPQDGTPIPSRYIANRANIAFVWAFLSNIDFAIIMPRQTGKSVGADCISSWIINLAGIRTTIQLLTKDHQLRIKNIKRLKGLRAELPPYLNFFKAGLDADNQETITCKALGNEYLTAVGQKDKDAALNVGRGLTSAILQSDEGPFCPNIHLSLPVALSSTNAARDIAEANGTFYGNMFTTTAGKRDSPEGAFMYSMIHNGMYMNERIYDCKDRADARKFILDNCTGRRVIINGTFSHRQVGKTDDWLREKIINSNDSPDGVRRDYLNIWTAGSETSPLSPQLNDRIREAVREVKWSQIRGTYLMRWYVDQDKVAARLNNCYSMISIDPSNAVGVDANGLTIQDLKDMSLIAASDIKDANLNRYAIWIADLLIQYPKMTLMIENKMSGQSMLDTIATILVANGINPFERIFNRIIDDPERNPTLYKEIMSAKGAPTIELYDRAKKFFGFMTSGQTREMLYGQVLQRAAKTTAHLIADAVLSDQIRALVQKNNRVDHPNGGHDDLVISWLMTHWFAMFGRNVEYYGIQPGYIQTLVSEEGGSLSEEDLRKVAEQARIKRTIDDLKEQLIHCRVPYMQATLELRLKQAIRGLDTTEDMALVFQKIVEECRLKKKGSSSLATAVSRHASNSMW